MESVCNEPNSTVYCTGGEYSLDKGEEYENTFSGDTNGENRNTGEDKGDSE